MALERVEHGVGGLLLLHLDAEADPAGECGKHLLERRHVLGRTGIVADDELAVSGPHVELDVVGFLGDRELERLQGVLWHLPAGAAVGEDERPHASSKSRCMSGEIDALDDLVRLRQPFGRQGAEDGEAAHPCRLRGGDPGLRVLEDEDIACVEPAVEELECPEIAVGMRLAVLDVLGRDDRLEAAREPGRLDHGLDLGARRSGHDRERDALGGEAHGLTELGRDARAVGDRGAIAADPLLDHLVDVRMVAPEPRADDLGVREAGQDVEVLPAPRAAFRARRRAP